MATGPRVEKRPSDVIGAAIMVGRIAVGEIEKQTRKPFRKVRSGIAGAKAQAENMSKEDRSAVARKAAAARWG